ncbi:MAG: hypothetical protein RLZ51_2443 [Pseudomonadota bacterium]|jgi:hypothetical protein
MCKGQPSTEQGAVRSFPLRHAFVSLTLLTAISLISVASGVSAQPSAQPGATSSVSRSHAAVFSALRVGQKVSLSEKGAAYEISLLNDGSVGSHVVVEIGAEHLVIDDLVAVGRRWIPLTAIRSVIWTRVPTVPR